MGFRLRHTSLFLTYVLAPLCAISNFNYEQVNPRNFPAAMLLHGRLSWLPLFNFCLIYKHTNDHLIMHLIMP